MPIIENEPCGKSATFTMDENGVLIVSGKGEVNVGHGCPQEKMNKTKKIIIQEGITSIAHYGLPGKDVTEISLPNSLNKIGEAILSFYPKLKKIELPKALIFLPKDTFESSTNLEEIVFSSKTTKIGEGCFKNCKSLKNLTIPDTVTYIGKNAFKGCKELRTITIPKKLKTYKADLNKLPKLTKVINHSSKTIPLDDCNGAKTWKVNGKKVKSVPPGKTATSKIARYKIIYYYSGGKAQGKCPKYYYYGKEPKLPKVKRKGYIFFGWFDIKDYGNIYEGFPSKLESDVSLTAVLIKVKTKRIAKDKIKITLQDSIRWKTLAKNKEDIETGYIYPKFKVEEYLIRIKNKKTEKIYHEYCPTRNDSIVCKINPKKEQYFTLSFNWIFHAPDGDEHSNDDQKYVGEKKFKIPVYKNK